MPRKGQRFYDDEDDDDYYYEEYDDDYSSQQDPAPAPAPSTSGKQHQAAAPTVWSCAICTYKNAVELRACEMCGVVRDSAAPEFASSIAVPFKFDVPSPDDTILGVQNTKRAVHPKNTAVDGKKPKSASTLDSGEKRNKGKLSNALEKEGNDSELAERMNKSMSLAEDEIGNHVQQSKFKGLPLITYKPEPWMLQGSKGNAKCLLHLVVVGHVDAGKSTLMGRILHTVGRISQKEMHKNQKEANEMGKGSFAYAWALDEGAEERARGVTITVAVAHFETSRLHFVLLDAPGHRDFVPSMISGASQADAAVLVVDASPGGFEAGMGTEGRESGQTREHAQLVRSLGISQLIVAVNKIDATQYSQERFDEIKQVLAPFLRQCGFRDPAVSWIPVSAITGENLVASPTINSFKTWYKGATLLEALDKLEAPERDVTKPFRLAVAEVIRTRSLGATGLSGKVETGAIKVGNKVIVMPCREIGIVKHIEQDGKARQQARAGDNVDIGLQGVDAGVLVPGGVLCHPDYLIPVATRFEVRILTLQLVIPIISGSQMILHVHHSKEPATVHLTSLLDAKAGVSLKRSPRCLTSGQSALAEVVPERAVCVEEYANFRALGRVILRSGGRTLAVGIVTRIISCQ